LEKAAKRKPTAGEAALDRAMAYIVEHFSKPPRLVEVAAAAGLSPFHLHREFRRHFGETPKEVMTRLQIERAKGLMLRGVPLAEVAGRCGFGHQSHLTLRFKMKTGLTPSRWLKREQGVTAQPPPRRRSPLRRVRSGPRGSG